MGLLGLRKFIDSTGSTRLLPVPLSEEEALAQAEQQRAQSAVRRPRAKPGYGGGQRFQSEEDGEEVGEGDVIGQEDARDVPVDGAPHILASSSSLEPASRAHSHRVPLVDHVLVDMNCIVHSCFGKHDVTTKNKKELIQLVMERLELLLTQVVVPRKSLTICLDGPAPYAKLQTQRLRRRKVALLDSSAQQLTSLAITAGSLFLVELENAIAARFKLDKGRGFLRKRCPVYLFGSTVMGEGEAKIARALAFLASNTPPTSADDDVAAAAHGGRRRRSRHASAPPHGRGKRNSSAGGDRVGGDGFTNVAPYYNPNDTVTVLGNDIDLVMTCLGATPYHNVSIVGPSALQLINVGDILYRWLRATTTASGGAGGESLKISPEQLPSMRVDFIFLFLLNGGDHYVGAGEVAMPLWRRYRTVRASYPRSTLVSKQLDILDTDFLADVLDATGYTGEADPKPGLSLLQSALWSLYTTVTGICPDYAYVPEPSSPYLQNLRAAAALLRKKGRQLKLHFDIHSKPLAPLEAYVALMPTEATLPPSVANALRQSARLSASRNGRGEAAAAPRSPQEIARVLTTSNDATEIACAAKEAVAVAQPLLSPSEKYLCQFTPPVQLNAIPPRQRLSRYEQHRMLATRGAIGLDEPIPMVRRLDIALCGTGFEQSTEADYFAPPISYTQWRYPTGTTALTFRSPYDSAEGERDGSKPHVDAGSACVSSSPAAPTPKHKSATEGRILLASALRKTASSAAAVATHAAEAKFARAQAEVSTLKQLKNEGTLQSEKRLRAAQRRAARLARDVELARRREADEDAAAFALSGRKRRRDSPRGSTAGGADAEDGNDEGAELEDSEDAAFLADIGNFLGADGDVHQLLDSTRSGRNGRGGGGRGAHHHKAPENTKSKGKRQKQKPDAPPSARSARTHRPPQEHSGNGSAARRPPSPLHRKEKSAGKPNLQAARHQVRQDAQKDTRKTQKKPHKAIPARTPRAVRQNGN